MEKITIAPYYGLKPPIRRIQGYIMDVIKTAKYS
jgi:hypothetical protein